MGPWELTSPFPSSLHCFEPLWVPLDMSDCLLQVQYMIPALYHLKYISTILERMNMNVQNIICKSTTYNVNVKCHSPFISLAIERIQRNTLVSCHYTPIKRHNMMKVRERCPPSLILPPVGGERADPSPAVALGRGALHLAWAAQQSCPY